ncbi:hypothetical protein B0H66DRAFT_605429 [Apodospora peruviana]|uniref:C2H2-type domain-containing protein n=1 Tax=Apodospora peruviana TaxID=516989 RepID=A0AAE0HX10_9PEZI|nr:hypothetical protein B0H66DRAFT_605429 [Apodospora peruviana]
MLTHMSPATRFKVSSTRQNNQGSTDSFCRPQDGNSKHTPTNHSTSETVFGQETTRTPSQDLSPPFRDCDIYDFCMDVDYDETQSIQPRRKQRRTFSSPKPVLDSAIKKPAPRTRVSGRQHRRRSRLSTTDDKTGNNDDDGVGDRSDSDISARQIPRQLFSCPFYKHNSMRNMNCVRLRLTRVRDVKQHLVRRHRRPIYCPTCGTVFPDSQICAAHIVARTCLRPARGVDIEGVDESQSIALARRVNRSLDERAQWFSIWDILFPDSPKPSSPYLSNHFEEIFGMMKDYWQHHGKVLVAELAGDGHHGRRVEHLSSAVVETLLDRFLASSQSVTDPARVLRRPAAAVESVQRASEESCPPPFLPQIESLQRQRQPSEKLDPDRSSMSRSSTGYHSATDTTADTYYAGAWQSQYAPSTATDGALLPYRPWGQLFPDPIPNPLLAPPDARPQPMHHRGSGGSLDIACYEWPFDNGDFRRDFATPFTGSTELGFDFSAPGRSPVIYDENSFPL